MVHPNYPNFSFDKRIISTPANMLEQYHEILKEITSKTSRNDLLKAQISASHRGREAKKIKHSLIGKKDAR